MHTVLASASAIAAAVLNVAGAGGALISLLVLKAIGLSTAAANVTTLVTVPAGFIAARLTNRSSKVEIHDITSVPRAAIGLGRLPAVSAILGTTAGAIILQARPVFFEKAAPVLVLLSALLILLTLTKSFKKPRRVKPSTNGLTLVCLLCGIYAGYFGAAVGALATVGIYATTTTDAHLANDMKVKLLTLTSLAGFVILAPSPLTDWKLVPPMIVAAAAGGIIGAKLAKKLPTTALRVVVASTAAATATAMLITQ